MMQLQLRRVSRTLLAAFALALAASPASAQIAAAMGHPLPAADLPNGTVTVRLIAGDPSKPAAGAEATLMVAGAARTQRADNEGRVTFKDIPAGSTVSVTIAAPSGTISSDEFPLPDQGGVRLIMSTVPFGSSGGGGGSPAAPFAGGGGAGGPAAGGGMPEPRVISGQGRPEQADPAGSLTVRLTHDDFMDAAALGGHVVTLVGYSDDKVTVDKKTSDAAGRVEFDQLDVTGATAYYAMALLPRTAIAGGVVDRVMSSPIMPSAASGTRLVLSGEKRSSTAPPVDDFAKLDTQIPNVEPGVVTVGLATEHPDDGAAIVLHDAATGAVVQTQAVGLSGKSQVNVNGEVGELQVDAAAPAGSLVITVNGGTGGSQDVLPGAIIELAGDAASAPSPITTDSHGQASFANVPAGRWKVRITFNGASIESDPFDLPAVGGHRLPARISIFEGIRPRLTKFAALPTGTDTVYYVESKVGNRTLRSLPFQLAPGVGTSVVLLAYERLSFQFMLNGEADDKFLGLQGRFSIGNLSWSPYRAGPDGLVIAMPHGFTGPVVGDQDTAIASADPGAGFRIMRALPPGGVQFHAGFSMLIEGGEVEWNWDLPYGAQKSQIALLKTPGLDFADAATTPEVLSNPDGVQFVVIRDLGIDPGQSMTMHVVGLPRAAPWKTWMPRAAGVLVMLMLVVGMTLALRTRRSKLSPEEALARTTTQARIDALMNELVQLESAGKSGARKDTVMAELEQLWAARGETATSPLDA